jgi:pimeloyl-ACP methyl ester carboxylesterase
MREGTEDSRQNRDADTLSRMTVPGSVVLVHGAGSGPWVFDRWVEDLLTVFSLVVVDLHDGLDVASASMDDYCNQVVSAMVSAGDPVALCGWSMGGLVALMAAQRVRPTALVLLEPSPPGEVQGFDARAAAGPGTFDPEEVYGLFPGGIRARPESSLARGERKQGIRVPKVECPTLVVSGDEFPEDRGESVAALYGATLQHFPGLSHWDLVMKTEVREVVALFLMSHMRS